MNDDAPTILGRFVILFVLCKMRILNSRLTDADSCLDTDFMDKDIKFTFYKGRSFPQLKTIGSLAGFQYISKISEVRIHRATFFIRFFR